MKQTSVFQDYTIPKYKSIPARIILVVGMFLLLSIFSTPVFSQDEPEYDEISVFLNVPRVGGIELPAVIVDETVFLPVSDFFSFLKIRNIASAEFDSITGFFLNQESSYVIDKQNSRITFQDKVYTLEPGDMIQTLDNLYLKSIYFGKIFGLECSFNFRAHLHNGDPLKSKTVQVPKNRPAPWNPPSDWVSSAKDSLAYEKFVDLEDWSLPRMLFRWEAYNGFRSRANGINTPYLWSFSNHYTRGKFVADNVWDANAVSKQCGAAVMLKALLARGGAVLPA